MTSISSVPRHMMRRLPQSQLVGISYKRLRTNNATSCNHVVRPLTSCCFGNIHPSRFTWSTAHNESLPLYNLPRHCFSSQQQQKVEESENTPSSTLLSALQSLPNLSPRILSKIHALKSRHDEISTQLQQGGGDQSSIIGKELSSLSPISSLVDRVLSIHDETVSLQELQSEMMLQAKDDPKEDEELLSEIQAELSRLQDELEPLSNKLLQSLVPMFHPDEEGDLTSADAVIDIRAGTGGDEAALFAAELLAGYEAIAKRGGAEDGNSGDGKAWDVEVLSCSKTDLGGVKEASLSISSRSSGNNYSSTGYNDTLDTDNDPEAQTQQLLQQLGPFGFFQYESGVHRVQRVPINDNKLQTSAVSVAVLPSISDSQSSDTILPPQELKIETMRASGAGGQHVNTTESAVRITHIPTGIMAYMQEERSQHKNKAKALKLVAARVYQLRKEQALKDRSATRSSLMGGGDRSERIRTYNFPQDRITDHRCKVSVSGLPTWLGGGGMVRKFGPYLYQMEREERVVALEEEEEEIDGKKGGKKR
jgi:peptide chain release factor 1